MTGADGVYGKPSHRDFNPQWNLAGAPEPRAAQNPLAGAHRDGREGSDSKRRGPPAQKDDRSPCSRIHSKHPAPRPGPHRFPRGAEPDAAVENRPPVGHGPSKPAHAALRPRRPGPTAPPRRRGTGSTTRKNRGHPVGNSEPAPGADGRCPPNPENRRQRGEGQKHPPAGSPTPARTPRFTLSAHADRPLPCCGMLCGGGGGHARARRRPALPIRKGDRSRAQEVSRLPSPRPVRARPRARRFPSSLASRFSIRLSSAKRAVNRAALTARRIKTPFPIATERCFARTARVAG